MPLLCSGERKSDCSVGGNSGSRKSCPLEMAFFFRTAYFCPLKATSELNNVILIELSHCHLEKRIQSVIMYKFVWMYQPVGFRPIIDQTNVYNILNIVINNA